MEQQPADELLVAVDGTGDERGVLSIAQHLARRDRINARVIRVENQSGESAAKMLSHASRKDHTRLVLVPLPEPGEKRVAALDTLVAIAKAVDVPILAVPRHQERLPVRVLVATDFSSGSARAARAALSVMGPRGLLTLLYVEPEIDDAPPWHRRRRSASAIGIARLLKRLRRGLEDKARNSPVLHRRRSSVVKLTVALRGEPATTILDYAAKHRNDLIVIGTRRRVPAGNTMRLGSVSMHVLGAAHCGVLVAQPIVARRLRRLTDPFFRAHHAAT
ncbi:MAG TPA: universal stress protein [Gemmatimonadaceae bacterium]